MIRNSIAFAYRWQSRCPHLSRGFGMVDRANKTEISADPARRFCSISKFFAGIAVMDIVEEQRLDLDTPRTTIFYRSGWPNPAHFAVDALNIGSTNIPAAIGPISMMHSPYSPIW